MSYAYSTATRNVDLGKSESELAINIRKATSIEESAPKRKHVRSCIVYTWDHKSSQSFWAGMKVSPILADEVQTFKALITIHKVLQEGHPVTIKEAQQNVNWLESLTRGVAADAHRGYGPLIREYIYFLLAKLAFHRQHAEFNGTFEYEEYISLKSINDPNEGYETISDLMTLQDQIDSFAKLVFSHLRGAGHNECRISALVPLVQESYGIYKFITSMLRAMHTATGDDEALEPLRRRYEAQHYRLVKFYYECSNLRYLTSLINVPKLPPEPPGLLDESEAGPALPRRPAHEVERAAAATPTAEPAPASAPAIEADPIDDFWTQQQAEQDRFRDEQERLRQQLAAQQLAQQLAQQQAERDFAEQQRLQAEQQRLAQEQLMRDQVQAQSQGRLAELERENLGARAQYERDRLMLEQYDRRVKALEQELAQLNGTFGQQSASKDEQIGALQEQVQGWRAKYEALAKLYSQLRHEHLELLAKFKAVQLKAASAAEAVERREKLERELKTKNLELADMIRERDRALHDKDRLAGGKREEVEKLERELGLARERADEAERAKAGELSAMLARYNREVADLEETVRNRTRAVDEARTASTEGRAELERRLREKEDELEVFKAGMDQSLLELAELKTNGGEAERALDGQIDSILLDQVRQMHDVIDAVLQSGAGRIDGALYELESAMQGGNQSATAAYVLSQIEKASGTATEFSTAFNEWVADGPAAGLAAVIGGVAGFAGAMADVLGDVKGLARLAGDDGRAEALTAAARASAEAGLAFFRGLLSFRLDGLEPGRRTELVIEHNEAVQTRLQRLAGLAEALGPRAGPEQQAGDLGDLVEREMDQAARTIEAAAARLARMREAAPAAGLARYEVRVHDSMVEAAVALTGAIGRLIEAATLSQREIVAQGRGSASRTAFYKKHNRWTQGLISAAKAVAASTNDLIETADGVLAGRNSAEQLIVAANDVAASTAQLVAASRVKAAPMSASQDRLEAASRAVTAACRALVRQVQQIIAARPGDGDEAEPVDYGRLSGHEFKVREMEQQVEIVQLENRLARARQRLGEMRKVSYRD